MTISNSIIKSANNAAILLTGRGTLGASVQNTTATGNGINGMLVQGGTLPATGTWRRSSLPYVLGGQVVVPQGLALTIEPGTVVKAAFGSGALYVLGALTANGTGNRIYFTSSRDVDSLVGGDTDDIDSNSAAPGDWLGILFESSSNGNALTNVEVRFGGGFGANIVSNTSGLTISNSTVFKSSSAGLSISGSNVSPTVIAVRFVLNNVGISFANGSRGIVTQSAFVSQSAAVSVDASSQPILGILNDADPLKRGFNSFACNTTNFCGSNSSTVSAQNNWWGSAPPNQAMFCPPANLDFTHHLGQEAVPPGGSRSPVLADLRVTREAASLRLTWEDIASSCGYDVYRGTSPNPASFVPVAVNVSNSFVDPAAALPGGPNYFYWVYVH